MLIIVYAALFQSAIIQPGTVKETFIEVCLKTDDIDKNPVKVREYIPAANNVIALTETETK